MGCDAFAPTPPAPGPAPRIVRTDLDREPGATPLRLPRDAPIGFEVDRLLSPRTVSRATVQVTSGETRLRGRIVYDPARRRVSFVPEPGQMREGLEYYLAVWPALAAWDGTTLERGMLQRFVASDEVYSPPMPAARPTLSGDVAPLLVRRCATWRCHVGPNAAMGLDLSSAAAIFDSTVGVASRERPLPPGASTAETDPRWGGMLLVDPGHESGRGQPAYSYLFYKIAGEGPILGTRMPPPELEGLSADEIAIVSDWIARGAPRD